MKSNFSVLELSQESSDTGGGRELIYKKRMM